ncbi:SPL family radical SAM protein [Marinicrinis sediminis]|uniref:Radical SAM protein n=1 Tax=Marinicrinis sediminis TaxID=1652465 RepID=A0ABW5R7X2_9BACL
MKVDISYKQPKQILTVTGGFLEGYTHSLNPYAGCAFACSYCYVRRMPVGLFRGQPWGTWVQVKEEAAEQLRIDMRKARKKGKVTIFMSSSTDPYQPVEYQARITRSLLEVLVEEKPDFLFVQTRSPLVTRDIDLFQQLQDRIRISMTIETDLERVRKAFSPAAPPIPARLRALEQISESGLPAQATLAPLLPFSPSFPKKLAEIVDRVCIDDFYAGDGSGGKRTEQLKIRQIYEEMGLEQWYGKGMHEKVYPLFQGDFTEDQILLSREGFLPD